MQWEGENRRKIGKKGKKKIARKERKKTRKKKVSEKSHCGERRIK